MPIVRLRDEVHGQDEGDVMSTCRECGLGDPWHADGCSVWKGILEDVRRVAEEQASPPSTTIMTVRDLIEALKAMDQDAVVLTSDSRCNTGPVLLRPARALIGGHPRYWVENGHWTIEFRQQHMIGVEETYPGEERKAVEIIVDVAEANRR